IGCSAWSSTNLLPAKMVRLVGSAGSLFRSYSARAWGSAGAWAQAPRARTDASAIPRPSVLACFRRQGPFVAPGSLEIAPPRGWLMGIAVMDDAPVCIGARLGEVLAGLISGLRVGRHIM